MLGIIIGVAAVIMVISISAGTEPPSAIRSPRLGSDLYSSHPVSPARGRRAGEPDGYRLGLYGCSGH